MFHFRNRPLLEIIAWLVAFLVIFGVALATNAHEALDHLFRAYEGSQIDEVLTALIIAGALGLVYSIVRVKDLSVEVARRLAAEQMIHAAARHDYLTGLPNRRMLDASADALLKTESSDEKIAAYSIDLSGLKAVNDNLGQMAGDVVLKRIGEHLSRLQNEDQVFHLGADRFLIVARGVGVLGSASYAKRIVKAIGQPIHAWGTTVEIGASVGYAIWPDDATALQTLVRAAECAMYVAKKQGRNVTQAFAPAMENEIRKRLQMEADLKSAIREKAIVPHYQPLVDLKTKQVVGYEALARWETSPGRFVSPGEFIPLAEETGLIFDLSDSLFSMACRDAMTWPSHVMLSFNISATQLSDRHLGLKLLKTLHETGLPVHRLEVEVTESAIVRDPESAHFVLNGLDQAGIQIALDDFGTGHSSLSQLSSYPFHKIKIDRSFVASSEHDEKQDKIVKAIIGLGASLGLKITAEGIEHESQFEKLEVLGCDVGQGYLLGRPLPARSLDLTLASIPLATIARGPPPGHPAGGSV
ncbi:putative bifunctional diguanylate cyclase/phosphodiesterase [Rhizobium sp. HT1-10]|uniref:putative bifunctional diguanylate cyclase/phosphodiesterase n=1 Tax=Rhizobium sp. HT1-10 TaxID=3111638 RepID=UPI003C272FB9